MISIILSYILVLATHLTLVFFKIVPGNFSVLIGVNGFLAFLFIGGILIATPGIKKGGENFVQRFLIITTAQLLMMLTLIMVLVFSKFINVKILGFSSIILFAILLIIQSIYLIKKINEK